MFYVSMKNLPTLSRSKVDVIIAGYILCADIVMQTWEEIVVAFSKPVACSMPREYLVIHRRKIFQTVSVQYRWSNLRSVEKAYLHMQSINYRTPDETDEYSISV